MIKYSKEIINYLQTKLRNNNNFSESDLENLERFFDFYGSQVFHENSYYTVEEIFLENLKKLYKYENENIELRVDSRSIYVSLSCIMNKTDNIFTTPRITLYSESMESSRSCFWIENIPKNKNNSKFLFKIYKDINYLNMLGAF